MKITPTTYADDISKYLTELGYPYTFNKSMLKTPNADHSINHIITMMAWLLPLTECTDTLDESEISYLPSNDFSNPDFTQYFCQQAGNAFVLWNEKRDDEFEQAVDNICDEMAKSGTGKVLKSLEKETESLEKELNELNKRNEHVSSRKKSFLDVEKELKEVQESKRMAVENCRIKEKIHSQLQSTSQNLQVQIETLQNAIVEVKNILKTQAMSVENRLEILTSSTEKRNILQAKKKSVCDLERMSSEKQVSISRFLKEKLDLLRDVNNYIIQLKGDLKNLIDFKVNPLQMQFSDEEVDNLAKVFRETDKIHTEMKEKYAKETNQLNHTLVKLEQARMDSQKELEDLEMQQQEWNTKRDQLHKDHMDATAESRQKLDELQKILDEMKTKNNGFEEAIKRNEQTINVLRNQTEMMIKSNLKFMHEKLEEKKQSVKEKAQKVKEMEKNFREQFDG